MPIEQILDNGIIKLKNNRYIKIVRVVPINYNLKSDLEKKAILNSYKVFLKTCNFNIQILIQSNKEDLSNHIFNIQKNTQKNRNKYLEEISKNYIEYIKNINKSKRSSSKEFYLILSNEHFYENQEKNNVEMIISELKENYFKVKECLGRCGNPVYDTNEREEILEIIFSFLNTRKYLNNK